MKLFKRSISVLLALLLAALCALPAFAAGETWEVEKCPTILIHGILQSQVFLRGEGGAIVTGEDGKPIANFPPPVDVNDILRKLALPAVASLLFQHDICLTKTARAVINDVFKYIKSDENGQPAYPMQVVRYPKSLGESSPEERKKIYDTLPMQGLSEAIGENNVYFFTYDSFGNFRDAVDELYGMIQRVKAERHVDKVNLVPISLGGALFNALIDYYPDVRESLNTVVIAIGALDGSRIVGDMFAHNLGFGDKNLYHDMAPALLGGGYLGGLINIAIRLFPKKLLRSILDTVEQALVGDILSNCTMLWSLVPSGDYEKAAKLWLSDGKHDEIKRQTDRYWEAQKNSRANIKALQEDCGVKIYAVAEYDFALYAIAGSWRDVNGDGVIHLDSTSLGAASGWVGTPLPKGYTQNVADGHNHISPDGIVDASAGTLPDHTFYFKGQSHEGTARSDVIIRLIVRLATDAEYQTVFSMEEWPQFNNGRETNGVRGDLNVAKGIDPGTLSAADAKELQEAIAQAEAMLATTKVVPAETDAAAARLRAILVKLGKREAVKPDTAAKILDPLFCVLNDLFYYAYGPRGFIDPFWWIWK